MRKRARAGTPCHARRVDRVSLIARVEAAERFEYVFFWGHRQRRDGQIDASCLSQWFPAPFELDGVCYRTAEHWMMAGKARLFEDAESLERILAAETPDAAKRLGRRVRGFDEATWERARFELVVAGSVAKFTRHERLGAFLLATADKVLVEASPTDRVWGIGLAREDARAGDPRQWQGENLLGFALMLARDTLRSR